MFGFISAALYKSIGIPHCKDHSYKLTERNKTYWLYSCKSCGETFKVKIKTKGTMHKLKNKHTGEVITTPYLAEVEEYLNSRDYEMKKPVYTKEMQECGELPPVGSFVETTGVSKVLDDDFSPSSHCAIDLWGSGCVCEVICHTKISGRLLPVVKYKEQVSAVMIAFIKPITTIEDELFEIWGSEPDKNSIINAIIEKYNITPK